MPSKTKELNRSYFKKWYNNLSPERKLEHNKKRYLRSKELAMDKTMNLTKEEENIVKNI